MTPLRFSSLTAIALACTCVLHAGNWNVPTNARNLKNPVAVNERTISRAQHVFSRHCEECHGADAAGQGTKSRVDYDLRTIVEPLTDGELYWKITHGVGKMPSYAGVLSDEERWLLVNYLRHLRKLAITGEKSAALSR